MNVIWAFVFLPFWLGLFKLKLDFISTMKKCHGIMLTLMYMAMAGHPMS
jgi:hypothetical protein